MIKIKYDVYSVADPVNYSTINYRNVILKISIAGLKIHSGFITLFSFTKPFNN